MRTPGRTFLIAACLGWLTLAAPARAQEDPSKYPSRPIHIIVGFAAGGGNDIIARVFGQKLSESLGQPVIVENKPGGGAIVATEYVAKSQPDGYTLLMSASGISINPAVYAKLPYDAINDFVAVSELASFPLIMIVNASSPIKSAAELVMYAKANPDKMNYASSSASFQLVTELFKQKTGAPMQVIPYKSANESVLAVVSGQVTTTIADAGPVLPQVKSGTVRALAVAAPKRMEELPDVPTLQEAGADVDAVLWSGIFVSKGTPAAIVKKLEGELMRIAGLPDVIARLKPLGIDTVGNSSEAFARVLATDIARWGEVAKAANIRIEQ
ncbi:tripartite tricarboxylate transporter substrate binding protein [Bradyrhizobium sp. KBS0727]|uniref:Bug family tripartite tricarboxylate transporter substrate binding protein n=1 Tax=unclassified Bradyrhizobium TaxID=2631580 RepID=UPI00110E0854|nr:MULTISPECIES: tripartite tricarboxylate transporter substrate binding protein [unclassified Bradyrhizobium]QDW36612.1 tripartite tricarboxylate transporter substrate binding protein [Bradyrhizobium sp. KBS0725]QDW43213.1 tripartite tricarboxylate transporter substrate binding protein [Bradyrhizobium sp. KBS0727]